MRSRFIKANRLGLFGQAVVGALLVSGALPATAEPIDYIRDIRPIFAEHCTLCHGPDDAKGGLRLTDREAATSSLKSGEQGIVPGKPAASALIRRVLSDDPDEQMPPPGKAEALTSEQIAKLRQWIAEGADWPTHWAYRELSKSAARPLKDTSRVVNEIDRFVLAGLAEKGIQPSPLADRYTLIKRLGYDLIGLPPTVEETDRFVNDASSNAYEKIVDRLLASPHFGERWGRHWLDKARYADSDGYEKDNNRMNAWRYRDWVIEAINRDLPFDEFTTRQLAGDLLAPSDPDARLATAFNRQTLTNTEGGTDKEQWRVAAVMDRTETLGSVWLGLTVGCARCHNHKYDQITHKEYYQFYAYFNNGDESNTEVARSEIDLAKYEAAKNVHDDRTAALKKQIAALATKLEPERTKWEKEFSAAVSGKDTALKFHELQVDSVTATGGVKFDKLEDGSFRAKGPQPDKAAFTIKARTSVSGISALRIEMIADKALPKSGPGRASNGNLVLTSFEVLAGKSAKLGKGDRVKLVDASEDYQQGGFPALNAIDGSGKTGWAVGGGVGKSHYATFKLSKPLSFEGERRLEIKLDQQYGKNHTLGRFKVMAATGDASGIVPLSLRQALKTSGDKRTAEHKSAIAARFYKLKSPEMRVLESKMAALTKAAPPSPLMPVRVISQRTKDPRTAHILRRGEFKQPLDPVSPGTVSTLPALPARKPGTDDRLDLARWLVNGDNPLVPRVAVNHVWANLFGEGIVRTVNDFGVRGERPTHPELLDWLARSYIDLGWSRKALIKTIVMSSTYRQSSKHRPELADVDPTNESLYRQNRFRVEAEILRDLSLSVSGLLSHKIGGPSVFPPMPAASAAVNYNSSFKWKTSPGGDQHRRGIYTFFKRTAPHPNLTTFDCPDSNVTCVKRTRSNTPIGALVTLNNPVYLEAAQSLTRRLLRGELKSDAERLRHAFRSCVARPPTEAELARLEKLLKSSRDWYAGKADEAAKALGVYQPEVGKATEAAAWVATVRIILNLDEFITRE
jgi:mono/diheme cytochrome c family protein